MKHFFRDYFWMLSVAIVLLTGCSTEQEVVAPDDGEGKGKITFSFPMIKESTTYATVAATGDESLFNAANMTIYMVNGLDVIENIFSGATITPAGSGSTQSATISVDGEVTSARKFYFVANGGSVPGLSGIAAGSPLSDLLALTTSIQAVPLSSTGGVLMTGSVTVQPDEFTAITPVPIKVTLKRRIARFDISNDSGTTGVTIKKVYFINGHQTAYAFSDKSTLPTVKGNLPDVDFTSITGANAGLAKSAFYLYPSDVVSIQLLARRNVNEAERLYNISLPKEGIQANKSYTIKTGISNTAPFSLAVEEWSGYGDVPVSSANPLKIVKSTVSSGNKLGWNGSALRFDVSAGADADATIIDFDITTLTSMGIDVQVIGATAECNITATKSTVGAPTQTGTETFSYPQTASITIPAYTGLVPFEAKVLIKDMYDQSQCRIVTISREDYYPAAHKGWAGCNIYWNGTRLAFDDVNTRGNESRQGVYFMWGSLWGISPVGAWGVSTTTLYSPAGTATTAADAGFAVWGNIQRIPNYQYVPATPVDDAKYRNWAFAYQSTDSASGRGDICKYMTQKGWAPGSPTKKWRMPTSSEFGAATATETRDAAPVNYTLTDATTFVNITNAPPPILFLADGTYTDIPSGVTYHTALNKPYFPASGRRGITGVLDYVGLYGDYWSSSPTSAAANSYSLYFDSTTVDPASNSSRLGCRPIRCVVDKYDPM